MTNDELLERLFEGATTDTIVHLTYIPGRAHDRGDQAADAASDWHKDNRYRYVGNFSSMRHNSRGELVITLFVHNRGDTGCYRAFNPSLGTLKDIHVMKA
jgi:hypothetical protein